MVELPSHEPAGYRCPFCAIAGGAESEFTAWRDEHVLVQIALHWSPANPGKALVIPLAHIENVYTLPDKLAGRIAHASGGSLQERDGGRAAACALRYADPHVRPERALGERSGAQPNGPPARQSKGGEPHAKDDGNTVALIRVLEEGDALLWAARRHACASAPSCVPSGSPAGSLLTVPGMALGPPGRG